MYIITLLFNIYQEKLKGRVQREIENIKKDNVDYRSYLPIGKTVFAKPKKEDISGSDNDSNNDDDAL